MKTTGSDFYYVFLDDPDNPGMFTINICPVKFWNKYRYCKSEETFQEFKYFESIGLVKEMEFCYSFDKVFWDPFDINQVRIALDQEGFQTNSDYTAFISGGYI